MPKQFYISLLNYCIMLYKLLEFTTNVLTELFYLQQSWRKTWQNVITGGSTNIHRLQAKFCFPFLISCLPLKYLTFLFFPSFFPQSCMFLFWMGQIWNGLTVLCFKGKKTLTVTILLVLLSQYNVILKI